jgi:hypothetical protein
MISSAKLARFKRNGKLNAFFFGENHLFTRFFAKLWLFQIVFILFLRNLKGFCNFAAVI